MTKSKSCNASSALEQGPDASSVETAAPVNGSEALGPDIAKEVADGVSSSRKPVVAVVMGSDSDFHIMEPALVTLKRFGVPYHVEVISAHRTPARVHEFANSARMEGFKVLIAGAGGAAHLPGMIAANTTVPVIGVPVPTRHLGGQDSLLSIVQMPAGVPVATMAIGGAENAAILAIQILSNEDETLHSKLETHKSQLIDKVGVMNDGLKDGLPSGAKS